MSGLSFENGDFTIEVKPNNIFFVQHGVAGFFVDGIESLGRLAELAGAMVDEYNTLELEET